MVTKMDFFPRVGKGSDQSKESTRRNRGKAPSSLMGCLSLGGQPTRGVPGHFTAEHTQLCIQARLLVCSHVGAGRVGSILVRDGAREHRSSGTKIFLLGNRWKHLCDVQQSVCGVVNISAEVT